jgi:hypothetical protein
VGVVKPLALPEAGEGPLPPPPPSPKSSGAMTEPAPSRRAAVAWWRRALCLGGR